MSSTNTIADTPQIDPTENKTSEEGNTSIVTLNDSISMFVGQLPRDMDQEELKKLFEDFGPIVHINIIQNRKTQESQGCCFVTFANRSDAFRCQAALHNQKRFPGVYRPVQMKPADSETETKLFVGMLPSVTDDTSLREIFCAFGNIVDCTVLKDQNGASKRCGFVTYSNRTSATKAINALNQNYKVPGSNHFIVVKLADKDQNKKRLSGGSKYDTKNSYSNNSNNSNNSSNDSSDNGFKDLIQLYGLLEKYGIVCTGNLNIHRLTLVLDAFADIRAAAGNARMDNDNDIGTPYMNDPLQRALNHGPFSPNRSINNMQSTSYLGDGNSHSRTGNTSQRKRGQDFTHVSDIMAVKRFVDNYNESSPGDVNNSSNASNTFADVHNNRPKYGSSSLLVNFLPDNYSDDDLIHLFSSYGNIVSARVYNDSLTNRNGGANGCVTFTSAVSAQAAMLALDRYVVSGKRISVQTRNESFN